MNRHINANTLYTDPKLMAAYWCGVYVTRRREWLDRARVNKSDGRPYSYTVSIAKNTHRALMNEIATLNG